NTEHRVEPEQRRKPGRSDCDRRSDLFHDTSLVATVSQVLSRRSLRLVPSRLPFVGHGSNSRCWRERPRRLTLHAAFDGRHGSMKPVGRRTNSYFSFSTFAAISAY